MSAHPPDISAALAEELERMPMCTLKISGADVLQIITMLQLALRHPNFREENAGLAPLEALNAAEFVRHFIATIRANMAEYPTVQLVIDYNFRELDMPRPC